METKSTNFIDYSELTTDSGWLIGIDCGHGGMVGEHYQTFPNKMCSHTDFIFYEGVFNRVIGVHLAALLSQSNISHYFTTDSNYDVSLNIRAIRANNMRKLYPDKKHLFLSIHANAAPKGAESATGIEVFTTKGKTDADPMAEIIYKKLETLGWKMRRDVSDGDSDKEADFYILRKTTVPAVLVELGFYTNRTEAKRLMDPAVQKALAALLFEAINEIIETDVQD